MKILVCLLSLFLATLFILGCSGNVPPNEHEQLYLDTTDSLRRYKNVEYMKGILAKSDEMRDHLILNFQEFKAKYNLTDGEMEVADAIYSVHIDVASSLVPKSSN